MSARAIFHIFLHAAVPALLAWLFWRKRFGSAWLLLLVGWLIDTIARNGWPGHLWPIGLVGVLAGLAAVAFNSSYQNFISNR